MPARTTPAPRTFPSARTNRRRVRFYEPNSPFLLSVTGTHIHTFSLSPGLGYRCECAPGYAGLPGLVKTDGRGCERARIKTTTASGMEFFVGAGLDYTFHTVDGRITLAELHSSLASQVSGSESIEQAVSSLHDRVGTGSITAHLSSALADVSQVVTTVVASIAPLATSVEGVETTVGLLSTAVATLQDVTLANEVTRATSAENSLADVR